MSDLGNTNIDIGNLYDNICKILPSHVTTKVAQQMVDSIYAYDVKSVFLNNLHQHTRHENLCLLYKLLHNHKKSLLRKKTYPLSTAITSTTDTENSKKQPIFNFISGGGNFSKGNEVLFKTITFYKGTTEFIINKPIEILQFFLVGGGNAGYNGTNVSDQLDSGKGGDGGDGGYVNIVEGIELPSNFLNNKFSVTVGIGGTSSTKPTHTTVNITSSSGNTTTYKSSDGNSAAGGEGSTNSQSFGKDGSKGLYNRYTKTIMVEVVEQVVKMKLEVELTEVKVVLVPVEGVVVVVVLGQKELKLPLLVGKEEMVEDWVLNHYQEVMAQLLMQLTEIPVLMEKIIN